MSADIADGDADAVVFQRYKIKIIPADSVGRESGSGKIVALIFGPWDFIELLLHGPRKTHLKLLFLKFPQFGYVLYDGYEMSDFSRRPPHGRNGLFRKEDFSVFPLICHDVAENVSTKNGGP